MDRTIVKMVEALNKHLPKKKRSLEEMLKEKEPLIQARDGNEYYIERKELEFISEFVDERERAKFTIPIILEMVNVGGEYLIFVRDEYHVEFLKRAFGFDRMTKNGLMLYTYEYQKIRRKLRTSSQVLFRIPEI